MKARRNPRMWTVIVYCEDTGQVWYCAQKSRTAEGAMQQTATEMCSRPGYAETVVIGAVQGNHEVESAEETGLSARVIDLLPDPEHMRIGTRS